MWGELWCVGVGSVGSCALFFLTMITRAMQAVLVDPDRIQIENVRRSALFSWKDALDEKPKVTAATEWLSSAGVGRIDTHEKWLHQLPDLWRRRKIGKPDVLISAANERNVRSEIESAFPPLQVYGTTGRNMQATLFRHIPVIEACSLCIPTGRPTPLPTLCATGRPELTAEDTVEDDVAIPFLFLCGRINDRGRDC